MLRGGVNHFQPPTVDVNKSLITNILAALLLLAGYFTGHPVLLSVGLFALSGAVTNWLAVHMLFEKVPGLYGSGVIPARFEEFKGAIRQLLMDQFFTPENIESVVTSESTGAALDLVPVIEKTDLSPAFDALVRVIQESSFGNMLAMVGGTAALQPLREPFVHQMRAALCDIATSDEFHETVRDGLRHAGEEQGFRDRISRVIEQRLDELSPQMVKVIVQDMIRNHLGWLVVWGGVFGGLIGLAAIAPRVGRQPSRQASSRDA